MNFLSRAVERVKTVLQPAYAGGGWFNWSPIIRESYPGAWQQNVTLSAEGSLSNFAVFACITRIAQDIAKIGFLLEAESQEDIWIEVQGFSPFRAVLDKPNPYQTQVQFRESWMLSKLSWGNTYVLKERDQRGIVVALHVLHPERVVPMVTPQGEVFYQCVGDNLAQVELDGITIPASEIIHDRLNCLFHPLIGISPIFAASMAATNGINIQKNSSAFFANGSVPGGVLLVPGDLTQANADELRNYWGKNFTGENAGKLAVLSGGMTYQAMRMSSADSQMIEQLKLSAQIICAVFHVPAYQIGMDVAPASRLTVEALEIDYYTKCLQIHIESMEACLTEGIGLPTNPIEYRVSLDLQNLTRMDTAEKSLALANLVKGGIMSPNEARVQFNLPSVTGGDTPYMQQQEFSLAALAQRDATNPLATPVGLVPSLPVAANDPNAADVAAKSLKVALKRRLELVERIS